MGKWLPGDEHLLETLEIVTARKASPEASQEDSA
jgi:hypothetical protein